MRQPTNASADCGDVLADVAEAVIRRATSADALTVQAMLVELATHEGDVEHVHVTAPQWRELLTRPGVLVLLAESPAGEPLGYASATRVLHLWSGRDLLALDDLFVRPGGRNQGLGLRLMSAIADHAATDQLTVTWGVRADNEAGQRFYLRLGATLRTKLVAGWTPRAYAPFAHSANRGRSPGATLLDR